MRQGLWCPAGRRELRWARIKNSLVTTGIVTLISLPFLVVFSTLGTEPGPLTMEEAQRAVDSVSVIFTLSLIASWISFLVMMRRWRERTRPPDRTHVWSGFRAGSAGLLPFRERQLSVQWCGEKTG